MTSDTQYLARLFTEKLTEVKTELSQRLQASVTELQQTAATQGVKVACVEAAVWDAKWIRLKACNLKITPNDRVLVGLSLPQGLQQDQVNARRAAMVAWIK